MINALLLLLLLFAAVWADLRCSRIPNILTLSAAAAGLALSLTPGGIGFGEALGGLAIGLAALLPLYALRAMGAGDVKLMAAAGSLLGSGGAFAAVVYTLVLGGLLTLGYAWRAGALARLLSNLKLLAYASAVRVASKSAPTPNDLPLTQLRAPYALAIAGGVSLQLLTRYLSGAGA